MRDKIYTKTAERHPDLFKKAQPGKRKEKS